MQQITEKDNVHAGWYTEAGKQTLETLPAFLKKLTEDFSHDYGTICHAVAAAAIGAAWAVEHTPAGGITGFQAGAIMWEFVRNWNHSNNKTGLKLIDYDNFLYPQYREQYEKVMPESTWGAIQEQALTHLAKADKDYADYLVKMQQYGFDIARFLNKYPDYYERKDFYDHLVGGTGDEWDAYNKKKESGFEFAPQKPYCGVTKESPVYQHWVSIVNGKIPFGYRISEA